MSDSSSSGPFAVGQHVVLQVGKNRLPAVVVEDRGPIGVDGEWIVRVHVDYGDATLEPDEFEVPAAALALAAA